MIASNAMMVMTKNISNESPQMTWKCHKQMINCQNVGHVKILRCTGNISTQQLKKASYHKSECSETT